MVQVVLFGLQAERVEAHLLLERAQRGHAQRLGLAAREQRRAVRARGDADLDRDVADLVLRAPVGALLVDRDALADDRLLELVESELDRGATLLGRLELLLGGALRRGAARTARGSAASTALRRVLALELVLDLRGLVERRAVRGADLVEQLLGRPSGVSNAFFSLPTFSASSRCSAQSFLISAWAMSSASRISASEISFAPASTIRIASSEPATTRSRSELFSRPSSPSRSSSLGLTTKLPSILPMRTAPTGLGERDVGDHQRR